MGVREHGVGGGRNLKNKGFKEFFRIGFFEMMRFEQSLKKW